MQMYYTKKQLQHRWKCHSSTIDYRVRQGDMTWVMRGGKKVIHIDEILVVEAINPVVPRPKGLRRERKKVELVHNLPSQSQRKVSPEPVKAEQPKTFLQKIYDFIFR